MGAVLGTLSALSPLEPQALMPRANSAHINVHINARIRGRINGHAECARHLPAIFTLPFPQLRSIEYGGKSAVLRL